jgi:hypothetical protein
LSPWRCAAPEGAEASLELRPLPLRSRVITLPTPRTLTPHSSLLTPYSSLLTPHSLLLTPHSSLLTPYSLLLTPYSSLLTPYSSLLTPHSLLLTPYSSLLTPHSLLLTPHSSLHRRHLRPHLPPGMHSARQCLKHRQIQALGSVADGLLGAGVYLDDQTAGTCR